MTKKIIHAIARSFHQQQLLILATQQGEHGEIATCGGLILLTNILGHSEETPA